MGWHGSPHRGAQPQVLGSHVRFCGAHRGTGCISTCCLGHGLAKALGFLLPGCADLTTFIFPYYYGATRELSYYMIGA